MRPFFKVAHLLGVRFSYRMGVCVGLSLDVSLGREVDDFTQRNAGEGDELLVEQRVLHWQHAVPSDYYLVALPDLESMRPDGVQQQFDGLSLVGRVSQDE